MNDRPKDTSMNSEWTDPVFDSLLEEAVTGVRPPDLLARITKIWQQELAGRIPLPTATHAATASGDLVAPPIVPQVAVTNAAPSATGTGSTGAGATGASTTGPATVPLRRSHAWQVLLVIAASGLLLTWAVRWQAIFVSDSDTMAVVPAPDLNRTDMTNVPTLDAAESTANNDRKVAQDSVKLELNNVPFANREQPDSKVIASGDLREDAPRLSDVQIVELIDTQLAQLWQKLNVQPTAKLDELRLAQSISKVLTGQELPVSAVAQLSEFKAAERRERVISMAVDSQSFARRWARALVSNWLGGGNLPLDSAPVRRLEEFVASGIAESRPWDQVVSTVLSGESNAGDVFVASLAGGGNHRMASRLSGSFLDSSLACVRCHEAKTPVQDVHSQQQYWSLVAMLMGLDARSVEQSDRTAIDKQTEMFVVDKQPNLFFDRPDGTLEAAKFVLPDGTSWQSVAGATTPRLALAKWVGNSSQSDAAIVNQVWQLALGRPLVASSHLLDDVGLVERTELQQFLAQQFRVHGRDLTQLVGWVVRTEAFARDALEIDRSRWLQAEESEIDSWHAAEMTFAARTSLGERAVNGGLENAIAAVVKWNQTSESGSNTNSANVLAQPNLNPNLKLKNAVKADFTMPAVGYVVHRGRLSDSQRDYIGRLVASDKLSWEQKVEHIVSLSPNQSVTGGVRRMSDELLKSLKNPSEVLAELLWALQNAEAS